VSDLYSTACGILLCFVSFYKTKKPGKPGHILLLSWLFNFDRIIKIIVDQNSAAIFADYDLLALADFALALGRNCIETTTAGITNHGNNG
jgi:hypothetical protein